MSSFLREHAVLIVAVACIPWSGFFLWKTKDILGLEGKSLLIAPFIYVITGLTSIVLFSILHDFRSFPSFSLHHQGLLVFFPMLFPLLAKILKRDWRDVSDAMAVSIPGIIAMTRFFCIINGCCYGLIIPGTSVHFPLREMVIIVNLGVSFLLMYWIRHNHPKGVLLPTYMIFYGAFRLLEVRLRFSQFWINNGPNRIAGVAFILIGTLLGIIIMDLNESRNKIKK